MRIKAVWANEKVSVAKDSQGYRRRDFSISPVHKLLCQKFRGQNDIFSVLGCLVGVDCPAALLSTETKKTKRKMAKAVRTLRKTLNGTKP
jgi:hypothetical protein